MARNSLRSRSIVVAGLAMTGLLLSAPRHAWAQG